jgi:hypothetical protein
MKGGRCAALYRTRHTPPVPCPSLHGAQDRARRSDFPENCTVPVCHGKFIIGLRVYLLLLKLQVLFPKLCCRGRQQRFTPRFGKRKALLRNMYQVSTTIKDIVASGSVRILNAQQP